MYMCGCSASAARPKLLSSLLSVSRLSIDDLPVRQKKAICMAKFLARRIGRWDSCWNKLVHECSSEKSSVKEGIEEREEKGGGLPCPGGGGCG